MEAPLILDYEIYDEEGPCAPYFTGRITDAEGRVICNSENEERAAELVDYVNALRARVARLEDAGKNIMRKIPATKNDYSGVGYCFGCGAVKWATGQGGYSEECKHDCALQAFRRALEEK